MWVTKNAAAHFSSFAALFSAFRTHNAHCMTNYVYTLSTNESFEFFAFSTYFFFTYLFVYFNVVGFVVASFDQCSTAIPLLCCHITYFTYVHICLKFVRTYLQIICYLSPTIYLPVVYNCHLRAFAALCMRRAWWIWHGGGAPTLPLHNSVNCWRGCRKWSSQSAFVVSHMTFIVHTLFTRQIRRQQLVCG